MNLLDLVRLGDLELREVGSILDVPVSQVVEMKQNNEPLPDEVVEQVHYATDRIESLELTWDQVHTMRWVRHKLGVTQATLEVLLKQRNIEPLDFGSLGPWLTDQDVAACRTLPAK